MKVFVVAIGGFEEFHIMGVYSDRTKAQKAVDIGQIEMERARKIYKEYNDKLWTEIKTFVSLEHTAETGAKVLKQMGLSPQEIDDFENHNGIFKNCLFGSKWCLNEFEVIE